MLLPVYEMVECGAEEDEPALVGSATWRWSLPMSPLGASRRSLLRVVAMGATGRDEEGRGRGKGVGGKAEMVFSGELKISFSRFFSRQRNVLAR